ncbi:hypothetical protein [Halobacillus litoralis]|uniref:hypothetical protein n=1 Tax=Halobacillus litoralis TaxID=45668 RepID=UPI001CFEDA4B|nr:hypothetical protein [Halobacillus litoralis]
MNVSIAAVIIVLSVVVDYLWFDVDRKRWGWMQKWTRLQKGLFLFSFIVAAIVIYTSMSFT